MSILRYIGVVAVVVVGVSGPLQAERDIQEAHASVIVEDIDNTAVGLALDIFDPVGIADGIVDEVFVLQIRGRVDFETLYIPNARVLYPRDWLIAYALDDKAVSVTLSVNSLPKLGLPEQLDKSETQFQFLIRSHLRKGMCLLVTDWLIGKVIGQQVSAYRT